MPAARVLIDGPSELVFDYAIPDGLPVVPGSTSSRPRTSASPSARSTRSAIPNR
jgi:hypothetical protein